MLTNSSQGSRPFRLMVRAGFVARSVTYAVIGGIALALAVGAGSASAVRPGLEAS